MRVGDELFGCKTPQNLRLYNEQSAMFATAADNVALDV
jgi:hypothetical protein